MTTESINRKCTDLSLLQVSKTDGFNKLAKPIQNQILSYTNISTFISLVHTSRYFKELIPTYFLYTPSNMGPFLHFVHNIKRKSVGSLPSIWQTAFYTGLPHVKEMAFSPEYRFEKETAGFLSKASKLEKIYFTSPCTGNVFRAAAALSNLTDIMFEPHQRFTTIDDRCPLFPLLNSTSLKRLTMTQTSNDLPYIHGHLSFLPNLEYLSMTGFQEKSDRLNEFIGNQTSLTELSLNNSNVVLKNETLLKLSKLKTLVLNNLQIGNLSAIQNVHSLELLELDGNSIHTGLDNLDTCKAFSSILKKLPNLKKVSIVYSLQPKFQSLIASNMNKLDKLHITFHSDLFETGNELDCLSKIKSLHLHLVCNFKFKTRMNYSGYFVRNKQYDHLNIDSQIITLPGLKEIHINLFPVETDSIDENLLIVCFNTFSHLIYSMKEIGNYPFSWTPKIIEQLTKKPLVNCKRVESNFTTSNNATLSTALIFKFFPSLGFHSLKRTKISQHEIVPPTRCS